MARGLELVSPAEARAVIASHLVPGESAIQLGQIVLAPHQSAAAGHLVRLLDSHGGALLADDVGLGKTFVALAVARRYASVVVVAPAGLREMWHAAALRADVAVTVVSYESLSRRTSPGHRASLVILDEAHHARSATAKRYARIAQLTARGDTLLLTATPIPNRLGELRTIFALFLGQRAAVLDESELARLIVRRTATTLPGAVLPALREPRWVDVGDDEDCLLALQQLPPPVPPADGGDGGALLLLGLVRQWASSRAALITALKRRLARAIALETTLATGRLPTTSELRAWQFADDSVQLAFPELAASRLPGDGDASALRVAVAAHRRAVVSLLTALRESRDPDADRARRLIALRADHPGERILCFTSFAETAHAYWRNLRHAHRVARLTANGGSISTGKLSRTEVLRRFAPTGQRREAPRAIEEITLLVTTDMLAEGIDLQDATVIVHLDLPWSPARLAQRVGRARRLGSRASGVAVYAMRPPASAERLLAVEARLRRKTALAARTVGAGSPVLPNIFGSISAQPPSAAERMSQLMDRISAWASQGRACADDHPPPMSEDPILSAVVAPCAGWLAVFTIAGLYRLAARIGDDTGDDPQLLECAVTCAEGAPPVTGAETTGAVEQALLESARCAATLAADACVGLHPEQSSVRRTVLDRTRAAYERAAPDRRADVAILAARARVVATGRLSADTETRLRQLGALPLDDVSWLQAVAAMGISDGGQAVSSGRVVALIALVRRP